MGEKKQETDADAALTTALKWSTKNTTCPGCDRYVQLVLFLGWLLVAMCFGGKPQTGYSLVGSVVMMTRETKKKHGY